MAIDLLLRLLPCPILRRQVILVLGVQQSVFLLELFSLVLIREPPVFGKDVPTTGGNTADLTMIPLRYRILVELPEVRPEEHKSVRRARGVPVLALGPRM